jgi:heat shock protein HslJ
VTVTVGRQVLRGCGGAGLAPVQSSPVAGEWRVVTIAGRPVARGSSPTIAFRGDRVSGNTGCNSFNGGYRFDRGGLTTGPIAATKRACMDSRIGQQEQTMLRMLGQPLRVTKMRNGGVVLRAARGETMVLARVGRR